MSLSQRNLRGVLIDLNNSDSSEITTETLPFRCFIIPQAAQARAELSYI